MRHSSQDLASRILLQGTGNKVQYDPEFFLPEQAIVVPVIIPNDLDGGDAGTGEVGGVTTDSG